MTLAKIPFGGLSGLRVEGQFESPIPTWAKFSIAGAVAGAIIGFLSWAAARELIKDILDKYVITEAEKRAVEEEVKKMVPGATSGEIRAAVERVLGKEEAPVVPTEERKRIPSWVIPVAIIGAAFLLRRRTTA